MLSRKIGQSIQIGPDVTVTVHSFKGRHAVRLAIDAPKSIAIHRDDANSLEPKHENEEPDAR
jgi:carbon storage regulator CsrA